MSTDGASGVSESVVDTAAPGHWVNPDGIPAELRDLEWVNWTEEDDRGKVPKQPTGGNAKSNDSTTWTTFDAALTAAREHGMGVGLPLAQFEGIAAEHRVVALDIDTPDGEEWVPDLDRLGGAVVERSPSGNLRVYLRGVEIPEWWTNQNAGGKNAREVKVFDRSGFVTVTGSLLDGETPELGTTSPVALTTWLKRAWGVFNPDADTKPWERESGRTGVSQTPSWTGGSRSQSYDDEWFDEDAARAALSHLSPNCTYDDWRNVGFALTDALDDSTALTVYTDWSRGAEKWDNDAPRLAKSIIHGGDEHGGGKRVSVATLIHMAKEAGWDHTEHTLSATGRPSTNQSPIDSADSSTATDGGETWETVLRKYRDSDTLIRTANRAAADVLLDEYATVTERETGEILVYNSDTGTYERDGSIVLQERLVDRLGDEYAGKRRGEILDIIRGSNVRRVREIGGPEGRICVRNGVLDLRPLLAGDSDTPKLVDHSPDYLFLRSLPVEYDPDADATRWCEFVESSAKGDGHLNLQEYVGYCLRAWDQRYKRACMILGPKDSGKSTFVDAVSELLGWDNIASENLNSLVNTRWGPAQLRGAYANITSELDAVQLENIGRFKTLTGGDRSISAEFKGQPKFQFNPTAKHLYATNQVPPVADADDAFHERMLHVIFPRTVPRAEQDRTLAKTFESELSGILNWALEGLARLEAQGGFSDDPLVGRKQELWQMYGDSTARFVEKCVVETGDPNDAIHKDVAYAAYAQFIDETPLQRETPNTFKQDMGARGNVSSARVEFRSSDRQRQAFTGVKWDPHGLETLRSLGFDPGDELDSIINAEESGDREKDDGSGERTVLGAFGE